MARTVSMTMRQAMNAEETGEVPIVLLTIDHPDLDEPNLISSDPTTRLTIDPLVYGTVSRGENYLFLPFSVVLPDDKDDSPPQARITIENIDRRLIPLLRSTSLPASVTMEVVLASSPDIVEILLPELDLVSADYDAETITITLAQNALQTEPYPVDLITPSNFPGLF
jgi:hypothetical protein